MKSILAFVLGLKLIDISEESSITSTVGAGLIAIAGAGALEAIVAGDES